MKYFMKLSMVMLASLLWLTNSFALEVDREVMPRLTLGGKVIGTLDGVDLDSDPAAEDQINVDDSTLLMRFDKRLYRRGIAGAVIGLRESDDSVRFQQLHAFYRDQDWRARLGRVRLPVTLLEFPLLRDEDLLAYTHVGNASSNDEYDQLYGEVFALDWFVDRKIQRLNLWTGTRRNGTSFSNAPQGLDSYGGGYVYEQPADLIYVKRIRHAGVLLDSQEVTTAGGSERLNAVIAGIEVNLNSSPEDNWSLAVQAIASDGIDGIGAADIASSNADAIANRARAAATSLVTSVRFTKRPHLLTRWQAGLTLAYKDFADVGSAGQWSIAPSLFYRLGQGIDGVAQLRYTDYDTALGGGTDTTVQLGLAFSLETIFNNNIGERDSILNLEHGYIR